MRLRDVAILMLIGIGTFVFLPVLIPAAMIYTSLRSRRMRRVAETFACVVCRMPLTTQAVRWADEQFQKDMSELHRNHPGKIFRVLQTCHAICPGCGTRYTYQERERTFMLETRRPPEAAVPRVVR